MNVLPPEVLQMIFGHLTTKTLKRSCRHINHYIGEEARDTIRARRLDIYHKSARRLRELMRVEKYTVRHIMSDLMARSDVRRFEDLHRYFNLKEYEDLRESIISHRILYRYGNMYPIEGGRQLTHNEIVVSKIAYHRGCINYLLNE